MYNKEAYAHLQYLYRIPSHTAVFESGGAVFEVGCSNKNLARLLAVMITKSGSSYRPHVRTSCNPRLDAGFLERVAACKSAAECARLLLHGSACHLGWQSTLSTLVLEGPEWYLVCGWYQDTPEYGLRFINANSLYGPQAQAQET